MNVLPLGECIDGHPSGKKMKEGPRFTGFSGLGKAMGGSSLEFGNRAFPNERRCINS